MDRRLLTDKQTKQTENIGRVIKKEWSTLEKCWFEMEKNKGNTRMTAHNKHRSQEDTSETREGSHRGGKTTEIVH